MKTLVRYIRLYFLIVSQFVKARMSYRSDFIIGCFGIIFYNIPSFFSLLVLFSNIPSLAGWSLEELLFIYGFTIISMIPAQVAFQNVWGLGFSVRSGNFIKYYFRPLNMMFYFMTETVDLLGTPQFIIAVALIVWSSIRIGIVWNLLRVLGALSLLLSASLVMIGLMVAATSTAFWIVNSFALLSLVSRLRDYARYPFTIFNSAFRIIFSIIVPIGFVAFYPVQWILHSEQAGIVPFFTPLVGVICFALGYLVWHMGTRRWSGTGT